MNLFGKAKKQEYAPKASPLETIKVLREQLDTLEKRENHMSKKVDMALAEAKQKAGQKDKKAALFALKRKKMYEAEVTKLQGARITMDSQINALESATVNIETFKAMQSGASALRNIRGNIDADKVEDLLDEMQEEKDIHDAIADAIAKPAGDLFDDEDLLQELADLEELEQIEAKEISESKQAKTVQPIKTPSIVSQPTYDLPNVPTSKIQGYDEHVTSSSSGETDEERELRELQASMLA